MTSAAISQLVDSSISLDDVVVRMFHLARRFVHETRDLSPDEEHKRRASYSTCMCPYCAAIKRYVGAKLRVRRLSKEYWDYPTSLARIRLNDAETRLRAAIYDKEQAKCLSIDNPTIV